MDFEEFKRYVRQMEPQGLVSIDRDAKLSTKTGRSKVLRGSKVFVASKDVRAQWKVNPKDTLGRLHEQLLEELMQKVTQQ